MRTLVFFGLLAGAIVALDQAPAERLSAAGHGLLLLVGAHWLAWLPWLTTALFARLWWRQREMTDAFREGYLEKVINPPQRRKRATR